MTSVDTVESLDCGVFKCKVKFEEHSKEYNNHYQCFKSASLVRQEIFKIVDTCGMVTSMIIKTDDNLIDESFLLTNDYMTISVKISGNSKLTNKASPIKFVNTFLHYNKNSETFVSSLKEEFQIPVKQMLDNLMYLYKQGYRFDCDEDEGYFNIRFESSVSKVFTEVTIGLLH